MRALVRLVAAAVLVVLLALMLGPAAPVAQSDWFSDKVAHVAGFLIIAWALMIAGVWRDLLGAALLALLIGALVEVLQGFVGRDRSLLDLVADGVGVALAWAGAPVLGRLLDWLEGGRQS
jgi:VanZ family protein